MGSSFDRLMSPESPEAYGPPPGVFIGCITGHVANDKDPKGRGWVQVIAPLIDANRLVPNGEDNWIPVTEEFTVNSGTGGTHRRLQIGTQVVLLPVYPGNGKNWIVGHCLPSSVDMPHPELNRATGITGSVTKEQIFKMTDDVSQSQISAFPHGVTDLISGKAETRGDRVIQTQAGSTMHLTHDGNARLENPSATTQITPEGEVKQRSAGGAETVLDETGEVTVKSGFETTLKLMDTQTKLTGPLNAISAAMKAATGLLQGNLGSALQSLQGLQQLSQLAGGGLGIEGIMDQATGFLGSMQEGLGVLDEALGQLETLQSFSPLELGSMLSEQVSKLGNISPVLGQISEIAQQGLGGADLLQSVQDILPEELSGLLSPEKIGGLTGLLDQLSYDPGMQVQAITDKLVPGGFSEVENLFGMGMEGSIGSIQSLFEMPISSEFAADPNAPASSNAAPTPEQKTSQIFEAIPAKMQGFTSLSQIQQIIQNPAMTGMEELLGSMQQGMLQGATDQIKSIQPLAGAIAPIQKVMQSVRSGDLNTVMGQVGQIAKLPGLEKLNPNDLIKTIQSGDISSIIDQIGQVANIPSLGGVNVNKLIKGIQSGNIEDILGQVADLPGLDDLELEELLGKIDLNGASKILDSLGDIPGLKGMDLKNLFGTIQSGDIGGLTGQLNDLIKIPGLEGLDIDGVLGAVQAGDIGGITKQLGGLIKVPGLEGLDIGGILGAAQGGDIGAIAGQLGKVAKIPGLEGLDIGGILGAAQGGDIGAIAGQLGKVAKIPGLEGLDVGGLLGAIQGGGLSNLAGSLGDIAKIPGLEGVANLDMSNLSGLAGNLFGQLGAQLGPQLQQLMGQMNLLGNSIPGLSPGALLELNSMLGELVDPSRLNRVYTNYTGAGVTTPYGGMGFGALGGSMFGAALSMLTEQAGMFLSKDGGASISSLAGVQTDESGNVTGKEENARVQVDGQGVALQALSGGSINHQLLVNEKGIFVGEHNLLDLVGRLSALEASNGNTN